jgi:hypothetical protein
MNVKKYAKLSVRSLNESQQTFSVGQIIQLGLLKNHKGEPYRHKSSVLRIINRTKRKKTPWGNGYAVSRKEIDTLNSRWDV